MVCLNCCKNSTRNYWRGSACYWITDKSCSVSLGSWRVHAR